MPLILNAAVHLDSDLAVDGLTLMEAVQGHWRWHYPGTPHMGIAPVLLSWVQARLWGSDAVTLVSGGTVAYVLVLLATFALAWRVLRPRRGGLEPGAPVLRLDGHSLALGPDHRRPSADAGLECRGLAAAACGA